MTSRIINPSSSYHLDLPTEVREQYDGKISSYWLDGEPLVLQLSSYLRERGPQVPSEERLLDCISKNQGNWTTWKVKIHPDPSLDEAAAEQRDENGLLWIHAYLVWPHLTVYATISGPPEIVGKSDNWALQALRSLRLTTN